MTRPPAHLIILALCGVLLIIVGVTGIYNVAAKSVPPVNPEPAAAPPRMTYQEHPGMIFDSLAVRDDKTGREWLFVARTNGGSSVVELSPFLNPTPITSELQAGSPGPSTGTSVSLPKTSSVIGQPTPTPIAYRECPYCHNIFVVTVTNGSLFFKDHDFVRFPISRKTSFETCATIFFRYIPEAIKVFLERGSGRIVDTPAEDKAGGK